MIFKHPFALRIAVAAFFSTAGFLIRRHFFLPQIDFTTDVLLYGLSFVIIVLIWTFFANINERLDKLLPFKKNISLRMALQLGLGTILILGIRLTGMYFLSPYIPFPIDTHVIFIIVVLDIFMALTINLAVISHYFIQRWKEGITREAELEKEKTLMRYHNLRNQVNPHFLFNSFSVVQGLIRSNPELAINYVGHLAKVYRYVIQHKEHEIVSLQTELDTMNYYMDLLKIRYENALHFEIDLDEETREKGIATVTLQMLIDNALKHNEAHISRPLTITLRQHGNLLEISNNLQPRLSEIPSNREGLQQLKNLYAFHSEIPVTYGEENDRFYVRLPLLNRFSD